MKALPPEKQKILQKDLQKLEQLQNRRKERPGNVTVITQLIGQQMLLSDHLRDAIDIIKVKVNLISLSHATCSRTWLKFTVKFVLSPSQTV